MQQRHLFQLCGVVLYSECNHRPFRICLCSQYICCHQSIAMAEAKDIAVLGGGFAGSYCANLLGKAGKNVTLFDMGRGVGEIFSHHVLTDM